MDVMTIILTILSTLAAIALKLAISEFQDWIPTIARRFIDCAVDRLSHDQRERYREELYADMEEYPGKLTQLYRAFCIYLQSNSLKGALIEDAPNSENSITKDRIALALSPSLTVDPPFGFFDYPGVFRDSITTVALLSNVNRFAREPAVMKFLGKIDSMETGGIKFYNCSSVIAMLEQYQRVLVTSGDASEINEIQNVLQKLIRSG